MAKTKANKERKRKPRQGEGAPTKYSKELAIKVCTMTAENNWSLKKIAKKCKIGTSTVLTWLADKNHKEFQDMYAHAKEEQADMLVEEMLEIADNEGKDKTKTGATHVNRDRLKVDTRKFIAAKLKPRKYGDRSTLEIRTRKLGKDLADEEEYTD